MKLSKTSGAVLAATAAAFILSGPVLTTSASAASKIHCFGVNSCKGQSACKSGNHGCKGQNSCKGQGYVDLSKSACKKAHGKVIG